MPTDQATRNKALVTRFHDAVNTRDADVISATIDELFEPDVTIHTPVPTGAIGREAIKDVFARLIRAYPDLEITTEDLIAEADKIAVRNAVTGTHLGEWMDLPATGKRVTYEEVVIFRLAGERVAESWAVVDVLSQLRQLGSKASRMEVRHSQGEWLWPPDLDALTAAPNSHRLLLENERVRVLEVTIMPGQREPEHTHRWPSVMIIDQPARIRYYEHGVQTFQSPALSGPPAAPKATWMDAEGPHSVENIDNSPYHGLRIEVRE